MVDSSGKARRLEGLTGLRHIGWLGGDKGLFNTTLSGVFYQQLYAVQQLFDIGIDATGRAQVAFNVDAEKNPS